MNTQLVELYVPLHKVDGLTLSMLNENEVEQQSVAKIEKDDTYNLETGDPVMQGINDDRMGTMDRNLLCKTCMGSQVDCPGHFGNIKLELPVYHGNMLDYVRKVLKLVCHRCSHLLADTLV